MSGKATGFVIEHFPITCQADRTRKLVLICVADAANQYGEHSEPGIPWICAKWGFDESTVKRHLAALVESGWLEVTKPGVGRGNKTEYRLPGMSAESAVSPPVKGRRKQEKTAQDSDEKGAGSPELTTYSLTEVNGSDTQPSLDGVAAAQPAKPIERRIAERVFERKSPRPAGKHAFPSTMKIAVALLAAGWHPQQIEDAMVAASTISIGAVEIELNRRRDQQPTRSVDDARDAPGGRIKL